MPWWTGISPVDGATSIEFYADAVELAEARAVATADAGASRLGVEASATVARTRGDVATAILAEADAWHADIVAVGARSLGTVRRWLIGSVSRAVLHQATMSVLIVRPRVSVAPEREAQVAAAV
jgi:nucleotide-binding universal stress UspA family protein